MDLRTKSVSGIFSQTPKIGPQGHWVLGRPEHDIMAKFVAFGPRLGVRQPGQILAKTEHTIYVPDGQLDEFMEHEYHHIVDNFDDPFDLGPVNSPDRHTVIAAFESRQDYEDFKEIMNGVRHVKEHLLKLGGRMLCILGEVKL